MGFVGSEVRIEFLIRVTANTKGILVGDVVLLRRGDGHSGIGKGLAAGFFEKTPYRIVDRRLYRTKDGRRKRNEPPSPQSVR